MLLARKGRRVLLLDRDRFPSDMGQSTHLIHPLGVAHLRSWGVLPEIATRAAPFTDWRVDLHGIVLRARRRRWTAQHLSRPAAPPARRRARRGCGRRRG